MGLGLLEFNLNVVMIRVFTNYYYSNLLSSTRAAHNIKHSSDKSNFNFTHCGPKEKKFFEVNQINMFTLK